VWRLRSKGHTVFAVSSVISVVVTLALVVGLVRCEPPTSPMSARFSDLARINADPPLLRGREAPKERPRPAAMARPLAAMRTVASSPAHELFGFGPYWTLGQSAGPDIDGFSTLDYFSVGVNWRPCLFDNRRLRSGDVGICEAFLGVSCRCRMAST
jgi:hypothetical protein